MSNNNELVNMYVQRDLDMNINPTEQIRNCMKKLGYLNINVIDETKVFLLGKYFKNLKINIDENKENVNFNIENQLSQLSKEDKEYTIFRNYVNNKIKRSFELSSFLDSTNIEKFYNSLTYDELIYIGY
jgi:HSP20 family molecular chaperone IbpA